MTVTEALELRSGDLVDFRPGDHWIPSTVLAVRPENGTARVKLKYKSGKKLPAVCRVAWPEYLRKRKPVTGV